MLGFSKNFLPQLFSVDLLCVLLFFYVLTNIYILWNVHCDKCIIVIVNSTFCYLNVLLLLLQLL